MKPRSRFQWYDVMASVEIESSCRAIPSGNIDSVRKYTAEDIPVNVVDMAPKSNKRTTPSAARLAAKRRKTERL